MGLFYSCNGETLRIVGEGEYTAEDFMELIRAAIADPSSAPGMPVLMDLRRSEAQRTTDELVSMVDFFGSLRDPSLPLRCAVVATSDLRFGLSRMASAYLERYGVDLQVFRDIASAEYWLANG
jgi:hypothetical protein